MDALQKVFEYQGTQVRTVLVDGEPWFVAKDVCEYFGDTNYRRSIGRLDSDEKGVSRISTPGGMQEMAVVNEAGLYTLLFYMQPQQANLPPNQIEQRVTALKSFKRWITHEVLPSLRKTGSYSVKPLSPTEALLQAVQILDQQARQIAALQEKVTVAHHRIDTLDAVNIIGDPQQRLNAMVRKYAHANGLTFSKAWNDYVQDYNTAFRTNLKLLRDNYATKNNLRKLTIPQYLAYTGHLEDGLRVADKMLNLN